MDAIKNDRLVYTFLTGMQLHEMYQDLLASLENKLETSHTIFHNDDIIETED